MAKYTGPKCKLCRQEGIKLYLKGARCHSDKCAISKKPQRPGQHGGLRRKQSDYGIQLREKQKVKRIYGLLEKQFRLVFNKAEKLDGITGDNLLSLLERRLDNVIYRLGLAVSRNQARQYVRQGKFKVNGVKTDIPSYNVKENDEISFAIEKDWGPVKDFDFLPWLKWSTKDKKGVILSLPTRNDIDPSIQERLIIEFYSR